MSYINEALKKAQKEKDSRYERFGGIIAAGPAPAGRDRKRRLAVGAAFALLALIAAGWLWVFQTPWRSPLVPKGGSAPAVTVQPAAPAAAAVPVSAAKPSLGETAAPAKEETPAVREAEALYREAIAAQRREDLPRAEALYGRVLRLAPDHVRALNNLGVLYMGQKKRDPAIALFKRAIVLKKEYVDPYYNLACLYAQAQEIDASLRYLKVAMALDGDVQHWVEKDADMKNVAAAPAFKKLMEGQKN
ncbi:MAG: tetratricopeptide repeat protein [Deltaproteobacteria bacterium]|nr:tetratricopeptide repeat protein [Deltaproteobacteria bacterium]